MVSWNEIVVGVVTGIVSSCIANYLFYRMLREQNRIIFKRIKEIRQYVGAEIRLADGKSGKLIELPDESIGVEWHRTISDSVTIKDEIKGEVIKREN